MLTRRILLNLILQELKCTLIHVVTQAGYTSMSEKFDFIVELDHLWILLLPELVTIFLIHIKFLTVLILIIIVVIVIFIKEWIIVIILAVEIWSFNQVFIILTHLLHRVVLSQLEFFHRLIDLIVVKRGFDVENSTALTRLNSHFIDFQRVSDRFNLVSFAIKFISNVQNLSLQLLQLLLGEHALGARLRHLLVVFGGLSSHHCQFIIRLVTFVAFLLDRLLVNILLKVVIRLLFIKHRILNLDFLLLSLLFTLLSLLLLASAVLVLRSLISILAGLLVFIEDLLSLLLITNLFLSFLLFFPLENSFSSTDGCRTTVLLSS